MKAQEKQKACFKRKNIVAQSKKLQYQNGVDDIQNDISQP